MWWLIKVKMFTRILMLICGVFGIIVPTLAQESERAALLRVIYDEVEVRRADTDEWLPLTVGSESPFGVGDILRTSPYGRVYLTFDDGLETLVLPSSTLELLAFEGATETRLHMRVEGRSVHLTPFSQTFESYRLETSFYVVVSPAQHFAVQTSGGAEGISDGAISVTRGSASVETTTGTVIDVETGFGLRVRDGESQPTPIVLAYPAHFAQMEGMLDGCPGLIMARGEENLNVRVGPGLGYDEVGIAENEVTVPLLGVTIGGDRYRIPFLSGFGWILAIGVQTDCDNLPVYPYNTLEVNNGVIQAEAREIELLKPFYGSPEEDYWFYR